MKNVLPLTKINQNEMIGLRNVNYINHLVILASTITGCVPVSTFVSLVGIPTGITSSTVGLKICAIVAAIRKYKSIIQKKRKKHDKIV